MFKSKPQLDFRKVFAKFCDLKRDCFSRLRYLKDLTGAKDLTNEKQFFYNHRSIIFTLIYDAFIHLDAAKHRPSGKSFSSISDYIGNDGINSNQREDLDLMLFGLEKCLLLLPELFEQRWQLNAMLTIFRKMLHYSNVMRIRNEGTRLFLIYFQIVGERTIREYVQIEVLYAALIPGVVVDLTGPLNPRNPIVLSGPITAKHAAECPDLSGGNFPAPGSAGPLQPFPNEPFMPQIDITIASQLVQAETSYATTTSATGTPAQYEYKSELQRHFLELVLDCSIRDCGKIAWPDYRDRRSARAFEFLISTFSRIYLPYIFPKMAVQLNPDRPSSSPKQWPIYTVHPIISMYNTGHYASVEHVRMPQLRRFADHLKQHFVYGSQSQSFLLSPQVQLQAAVIHWFTKYLMDRERGDGAGGTLVLNGSSTLTQEGVGQRSLSHPLSANQIDLGAYHSGHTSALGISSAPYPTQGFASHNLHSDSMEREYIRSLLNSKRIYVDLILSLFHETLLLPFTIESANPNRTPMRNVIKVFRQWIHKETISPLPLFLVEPPASITPSASPVSPFGAAASARYAGQMEDSVCGGLMNFLNVFILSSANVFLLEIPPEHGNSLNLQVDICKRVFNTYRFMVMKVDMDRSVWENLVNVLIQVTRSIVKREVPLKREDSLGGRLAPALFQTLIVTWIKANLNVPISAHLWDAFHQLVSSLTRWEELINEWSNTMYILNRVMSRYVFNINLNELPLEKMGNDRKKRLIKAAAANAGSQPPRTIYSNHTVSSITTSATTTTLNSAAIPSNSSTTQSVSESMDRRDSSGGQKQRIFSNDESCINNVPNQPQPPPRHRRGPSAAMSVAALANTVNQSVLEHRQFHLHNSVVKLYQQHSFQSQSPGLFRSLSDSCFSLPIHHPLCVIRNRPRMAINYGKRSFGEGLLRSTRSSQKSTYRNSGRVFNRGHSNNGRSHLPMIDDDMGDMDEMVKNCTIVDHGMHGPNELDFSDASSTMDSGMDGYYAELIPASTPATADALYANSQNDFHFGLHFLKPRSIYRSYSMDDINHMRSHSSETTDNHGRHWSIWSDSGQTHNDGNSLKDQPIAFNGSVSTSSTCSNSVAETMSLSGMSQGSAATKADARPVLLGGTHKGWNAEVSVVLWRRMLGILGDLNDIPDPAIHRLAFECLVKITDDFIKMKDNISFLINNGTTVDGNNALQPSLHYFTAWLFRATTLPNEYKAGKLLAYKLLCIIALHRCEQSSPSAQQVNCTVVPEVHNRNFLILFYLAIKRALITYDMELTCIIIKYCGAKFFSSALFGSSCLLFDFISASNMIVSSQETKWPRAEALHLLGSLIGFFDVYSSVLILKSTTSAPSLETYKDLKEHVLEILIIASKREQTGLGRSIALCSLGIFLYKEFQSQTEHHRVKEIISILIAGTRVSIKRPKSAPGIMSNSHYASASTASPSNLDNASKFNNRVLCRVACDQLRLQTDHAAYLVEKHPDIARRVIEGLCYTLSLHIEVVLRENIFKDFKNLLISIMFTLAQWCMSMPKDFLTKTAVSCDYPNFVDSETNATKRGATESKKDPATARDIPFTLFQLVTMVFHTIANLSVLEIAQRSLDHRQMDALNGAYSFSDMDTIDYTINHSDRADSNSEVRFNATNTSSITGEQDNRIADANTVKQAAQLILHHFLTFMGHFPLPKLLSSSLGALINEVDDNPFVSSQANGDKLELDVLNLPNVLTFIVNGTSLISFVELAGDCVDSALLSRFTSTGNAHMNSPTSTSSSSLNLQKHRPIRVIVRNLLGKFAWNCVALQAPLLPDVDHRSLIGNSRRAEPVVRSIATASNGPYQHHHYRSNEHLERPFVAYHQRQDNDYDDDDEKSECFQQSLRKDVLEQMVSDLFEQTPECRPSSPLENENFLHTLNTTPEAVDIVALFTNQHYQERQFQEQQRYPRNAKSKSILSETKSDSLTRTSSNSSLSKTPLTPSHSSSFFSDPSFAFQQCRQLIEQIGVLSQEKRPSIDLLAKNAAMLRELRHLDGLRGRETHKIAVVYVGFGQETKEAILQNKCGSRQFEEFVSRIGWEVNLATHVGFMGGLESNLSTGLTAPYFADSFNEVIFHVSTRLEPHVHTDESIACPDAAMQQQQQVSPERLQLMNKKMRHLGNDEVHIVWSEHYKEYRRNILATEFCDALIVIYPLPAHIYPNLYRIQVSRKPDVPFFGPLFNGVVVHQDELAALVRSTAINASRAKRLNMTAYKHHFEERFDTIQAFSVKHRNRTTFEEFATRAYAPRYDLLPIDAIDCADSAANIVDSIDVSSSANGRCGTASAAYSHLSIEQFLASTGGALLTQSLSLSPSTADSLSIASTTATSTISDHHSHQRNQTPPPTAPPLAANQQHAQPQQYSVTSPSVRATTGSSLTATSNKVSRPTSRSSVK